MKTLYFDCAMGAAGDMLTGALLELHPDPDGFLKRINGILAGRAEISAAPDKKQGLRGTHVTVSVSGDEEGEQCRHHHHHTSVHEIFRFIDEASLPEKVREDAKGVYSLIFEAESQVHGEPVENIHLHEVGSLDALADVLAVCMLLYELTPEHISASAVHVGCGMVKCAHGILPVPAPATELILRGVPIYSGEVRGELCTPTGAALLRYFVQDFGAMPVMWVTALGCGTGKKDFEAANVLRAMLGETEEVRERVTELCCNLDDMTPEALAFAMEALFALGALDVYFTNIGMKKSRPGVMLTCMCREEQREDMLRCIFKHTSTLGVREYACARHSLRRSVRCVETEYGAVRVKTAEGWGIERKKAEYEDLARLAREHGLTLEEIRDKAEK